MKLKANKLNKIKHVMLLKSLSDFTIEKFNHNDDHMHMQLEIIQKSL